MVELPADIVALAEAATGERVSTARFLSDGQAATLYRIDLADRRRLVAKIGHGLETEGFMLRLLAQHAPTPTLHYADDRLLLMDFVAVSGSIDARVEEHAADLIAALHDVKGPHYGLSRSTVIGALRQPNDETDDWIAFFRDQRLLTMARSAFDEGRITGDLLARIERVGDRLSDFLVAPQPPALIHGDLWDGNVLTRDGRVAALIDPALYYADPEIELAFTTLFGTFGDRFFCRYAEHRPIAPGFFEARRDLYNLYPLLVHVRLFGGSYVGAVDRVARRFVG